MAYPSSNARYATVPARPKAAGPSPSLNRHLAYPFSRPAGTAAVPGKLGGGGATRQPLHCRQGNCSTAVPCRQGGGIAALPAGKAPVAPGKRDWPLQVRSASIRAGGASDEIQFFSSSCSVC